MNKLVPIACLALLLLWGSPCFADEIGAQCLADLDDVRTFLENNDASIGWEWNRRVIGEAYQSAQLAAPQATEDAMCEKILRSYLWAIRKEHLELLNNREFSALAPDAARSNSALGEKQVDERGAPLFRELDKDTILLRFPSFDYRFEVRIAELLEAHRAELAAHKHWIIDVADNVGDADAAYAPLLPWLLDAESLGNNRQWLVTPANISANEEACDLFVRQKNCRANANAVLTTVNKGPGAPRGYPLRVYPYAETINFGGPEQREAHQPERVAVMIGGVCASACENFLRQVRSSFRAKLLGQPTFDAGWVGHPNPNLRRHGLPSGKRVLMYLSSSAAGPTGLAVVEHAVEPDLILPHYMEGDRQVAKVQRWLAGIPFETRQPFMIHAKVVPPATHRLQ